MPLGEIAGSVFGVILRVVSGIFTNVILEILIQGPGYLLLKHVLLRKEDIDPNSAWVLFVGALFWLAVGTAAYWIYQVWLR